MLNSNGHYFRADFSKSVKSPLYEKIDYFKMNNDARRGKHKSEDRRGDQPQVVFFLLIFFLIIDHFSQNNMHQRCIICIALHVSRLFSMAVVMV